MSGQKAKTLAGSVIVSAARYMVLIACSYLLLYPFLFMISGSFKNGADFSDPTVNWIPKHFTVKNIALAMEGLDYWRSFGNTLIYGMVSAILQFCVSAFTAYGLARFKFKGRSVLMSLMFLNILVPVIMLIVPLYVNFYKMDFLGILGFLSRLTGTELRPNLLDTPLVFWLPSALGVGLKGGLFIYIFTQFFKGLPKEIEEAAWIDGAGPFKTFLRIIMPSSGSASVTVLLFSTIWNWSDYFLPQMYLSENFPLSAMLDRLPDGLAQLVDKREHAAVLLAACLLFLIPVILFYILLQKKFMASIATTGITGT